jgi:ribonuclease BN (tRNA processing enzyme)
MAMEHSLPTVGYRFEHLLNSPENDIEEVKSEEEEFKPDDLTEEPDEDMDEEEGLKPPEQLKVFAYSGDTSPCENLVELARDADCFLMEISSDDTNPVEGHSTIRQAAEAAEKAGAKITVFTHISPENDMADVEKIASETFSGMAIKAKDGMRLII